ncbi:hypothetical protein DV711_14110 [Motiliproteus coralliicola]|uniref:PhoP regulatory network protein YrbL n=1 Tax=Motiliproteus coralliicola TaxID=2283196 RepID=A0A369WAA1_9GAMM|nr:YrbL family protein [Motiliproteus coralliicola]RDE18752.1 hypothetical protein DV711_14110 [Motiliproteus coralliicola]
MHIELTEDLYLSEGNERVSYIHPMDSSKIIKIEKKGNKSRHQNDLDYFYFKLLEKKRVDLSHITSCYGWVETNFGKGVVFDRVSNYDNSKELTLEDVIKEGALPKCELEILLDTLKNYLVDNKILFVDVSLKNVLLKKEAEDKNKLIIVDGLGARRFGLKFFLQRNIETLLINKTNKQWNKLMRTYKKLSRL